MDSHFWDSLLKTGPVGIFVVIVIIIFFKFFPAFWKSVKEIKTAAVLMPIKAGDESVESWVLRIENSMRKVIDESFKDRDIHIKNIVDNALDEFLRHLKEEMIIKRRS